MASVYIPQNFLSGTSTGPSRSLTWIDKSRGALHLLPQKYVPRKPGKTLQINALVMKHSGGAQDNVNDFLKRMEQTWMITKQPRPVQCKSCNAVGTVDCPWCKGTGFFVLGDNVLCEVSSRNTSCYICLGQGTISCDDCKGTGYRAKWLGDPNKPNEMDG